MRRRLGLFGMTALVVGNMVGSGVFLLPATLAPFGAASVLGWLASACGSLLLGAVVANLAWRQPAVGGPYAWVRSAFGDLPAFLVGWGYWISCWCAQAAISIAMVGYLAELLPVPARAQGWIAGIAIAGLCLVNLVGVREAGLVQVVTTVLKLVPLLAIAVFGIAKLDPALLVPFNPSGRPLLEVTQSTLALTLWAFLGFESAAIAAGEAEDPRRVIPRATALGIAIATVLYVASSFAVLGLVPRAALGPSTAPYADAARVLWGPTAGKLVAAGAFVSCLGALNGWILVSGQMPLALAKDRLFPAAFGVTGPRGTPTFGLVISCALGAALVLASESGSLVAMYQGMLLLSSVAALVALVFMAMAEVALQRAAPRPSRLAIAVALGGFCYGLLAIAGAGQEAVFWGFLLLLSGIPFHVFLRR